MTLANVTGKLFGKTVRQRAMPVAGSICHGAQSRAGLNEGSTAVAHLTAEAYVDAAAQGGLSLGLLFVDVKATFPNIVGVLMMPAADAMDSWRDRLRAIGLDQDDNDGILAPINHLDEWIAAGSSQHLLKLVTEMHTCTWFSIEGLPGVGKTKCGVLAGTSMADILFCMGFQTVIQKVKQRLRNDDRIWTLPCDAAHEFFGRDRKDRDGNNLDKVEAAADIDMDDLLFPTVTEDASNLVATTGKFAEQVFAAFAEYGFVVNTAKGKTEAMLFFHGKGSEGARRRFSVGAGPDGPMIPIFLT